MNISNPMHPLDALFAKIPLHDIFKSIQLDELNSEEGTKNKNKTDQKLESECKLV